MNSNSENRLISSNDIEVEEVEAYLKVENAMISSTSNSSGILVKVYVDLFERSSISNN